MPVLESSGKSSNADVILMDGTVATLRQARLEDSSLLDEFLKSLSEETISFRFSDSVFERHVLLQQLIPNSTNWVLIAIQNGRVIGHTAYYRSGKDSAEIGLVVLDCYQGKGLGTMMLEKIAHVANENGISVFETIVSKQNTKMIRMVRDMGFPTAVKLESDMIRIRFPTSIDPITIEAFER